MTHDELMNNKGLLEQISELKSEIKNLENDLIHDSLTGLKTRAFFEEETKTYLDMIATMNVGKRREWFGFKNLSILFFDIDHFKSVNDTYGHDAGDFVLKKVAETIQKNLRQGDTASRWGGEEMVVSLLGATQEDALTKAQLILDKIRNSIFPNIPELKVTASIGVAVAEIGISFEELVKRADSAMYSAKTSGRNKVVLYTEK